MAMVFIFLGHRNLQIGDFNVFIFIFLATIGVSLFIFWFFWRGKKEK